MENLNQWQCGHCGLVVDLPDYDTEHDQFVDAMNRIREHRWAHLVTAFESGSDRELAGMCGDAPDRATARVLTSEPVGQEDVDSCIATVTGILEADLPRARQLWYPIKEDGSFNR